MNAYELPTSLTIGEVVFPINYGWKNILDVFSAVNDPDMDKEMKAEVILKKMYPNWMEIPTHLIPEAIEKACDFFDCGCKKTNENKPQLLDWEQDASFIIPAINSVAKQEIRSNPDIHWWTFYGWFMAIEGGLFSSVIRIRQKQATGKKLDKCEEEFLNANRTVVELQKPQTAEEKAVKEYFDKWLK